MRRLLLALVLLLALAGGLPPLWFAIFPVEALELPPAGRRIPVAEGVAVNALDRGAGPALVLVHGLPGSAYDWQPLADRLVARGYRVLAYDRVGYGRSDGRRDGAYNVEGNAGDLLALLRHEDLRDATLVGWSYGGVTSIVATERDPSRIARVVLVGSAGPLLPELSEPPAAVFAVLFSKPVMAWMGAVPPVGRGLQRTISAQAFSDQAAPDWWDSQVAANFARPHTRDTYRLEGADFGGKSWNTQALERPILVIHGDDDRLVPIAVGRALHDGARRSELMVVEGGSHMLPITHADLLADRIAAFVAE